VIIDPASLKLSLIVPQAFLKANPRGYISSENWDSGVSALFINYNANYYHTDFDSMSDTDSAFINLSSGINLGQWRLRNQSFYLRSESEDVSSSQFESTRTYVSRAIPQILSDFSIGELNSQSTKLSNFGFNGVQIQTDNRMRPESQRGYAPVIRGIAKTSAKVTVKQNNRQIYQTSVAPGPFEINDLYSTAYRGDLLVEVTEADGQISSFTVPYSATPGSKREGQKEFSAALGKTNQFTDDSWFFDASYETGLTNLITANGDLRVSDGYYALGLGGVLNTSIGAFGSDAIYSVTESRNEQSSSDGWRFGVNYSRSFDTGTTVTLAGYRYSTTGYRELADVLSDYNQQSTDYTSGTYMQREQMNLSINQSLGNFGILNANGSKRTYRGNRQDDEQYGLGYSVNLGTVNLGVNYARNYVATSSFDDSHRSENLWSVNLSVPIGSSNHMLNSGYTHSDDSGDSADVGVSGTLGEDRTWSYSVNASRQLPEVGQDTNRFNLSLNKRTSVGTFGGNFAKGANDSQFGANASGSVVIHHGGINLAQSVGDTFAIIRAPGAEGAQIMNRLGQRISSNGYGLAPNLIPYRENDIMLGGEYSPYVEILSSGHKVIPMAGAVLEVDFDTRKGYPLLIETSINEKQTSIPIGAVVTGEKGEEIGVSGQNGYVYARVDQDMGNVHVSWDNKKCVIHYDLSSKLDDTKQARIFKLKSPCKEM
ncbi:fimbria/pilus outer membrane usher protein, partial [Vibrio sp. V39_P1S14PM300]|uniref:fimbria/pilus outer membrane usher protein n=1 Tax=Vibrio sp. V39_P1S14PM300 TaxID=1938690 RepID=UPI00137338C7